MINYDYISKCLNICDEHINEGGGKITSILLREFLLPEEIKNLIKNNYKIVKKIIDFYYKDFSYKSNKSETFDDVIKQIEFIKNKNNEKKNVIIEYNEILLPWLLTTEFFINIYENNCPAIIDITEIKSINKISQYIPRENQVEAFQLLEKYGLLTGIHCQATGCGKSFIIIKYIDYINKNKINPKVILFTERVNILSDLFSFSKDKGILQPDPKKIQYWKDIGVGDLTKYNIINRVTNKEKKWHLEFKNSTGPTLLVINRAFLTLGKKYNIFEVNDIDLILHDECHNTTSIQCHDFLLQSKKLGVKIVGFSATPLRTGKHDKTKLLQIYSNEQNELNLLTNYNMIYAISRNLILPPEFYWYQIDSYVKKEETDCLVTQEELGSVLEILNYIIPSLPNKKIIAWCGTISMAKHWKELFEKSYKQRPSLRKFKFGLDTSETKTNDYDYFSKEPVNIDDNMSNMYYGNSILFCANKHREGSDIKLLDCCIFLDKVKDRSSIPFIQSIGRALRLCPDTENKTKGVIIDGFIKDKNNYEKEFIDKIIGYYLALENISKLDNEQITKYDQYVKIIDIVKFDKEKQVINMKLGTNIIKIHCNKLEWESIISKFDNILQEKIKLSEDEVFYLHIEKIKKLEQFKNYENNFWKEYKKLDHNNLGLPEDIYEPFKHIWDTKTWYDLLGFQNKYTSLFEFRKLFSKKYPSVDKINKSIYKKVQLEFNLPNYPFEYYRIENIINYNNLL